VFALVRDGRTPPSNFFFPSTIEKHARSFRMEEWLSYRFHSFGGSTPPPFSPPVCFFRGARAFFFSRRLRKFSTFLRKLAPPAGENRNRPSEKDKGMPRLPCRASWKRLFVFFFPPSTPFSMRWDFFGPAASFAWQTTRSPLEITRLSPRPSGGPFS